MTLLPCLTEADNVRGQVPGMIRLHVTKMTYQRFCWRVSELFIPPWSRLTVPHQSCHMHVIGHTHTGGELRDVCEPLAPTLASGLRQ